MPSLHDVLTHLEKVAPACLGFEGDPIGLQLGDEGQQVLKAVIALDRSLGAAEFAITNGCQLLLTHHPLIYEPLRRVVPSDHVGRTVARLMQSGLAFAAAHTNWDCAPGGVNDVLARLLSLANVRPFGAGRKVERLKLVTFCPPEAAELLVDALAAAGAGIIGAYSRCAFHGPGFGTFVGSDGSHPTIGVPGAIERIDETRLEMVLPADRRLTVLEALRRAHPYEQPAYDVYTLVPEVQWPVGRVGDMANSCSLAAFTEQIEAALNTRCLTWGRRESPVRRVAVVGGAADGEWSSAKAAGADVLVTGEVRQHIALEASESGIALVAAGHYATEHPGCEALAKRMAVMVPDVEWLLFEPGPGLHGRPF